MLGNFSRQDCTVGVTYARRPRFALAATSAMLPMIYSRIVVIYETNIVLVNLTVVESTIPD